MTRKIKQYLYSLWLKPLWTGIKYSVLFFFYIWIGIKKLLRVCGIPAIVVSYRISDHSEIKSTLIIPFQQISFPVLPLFNGREKMEHYDHIIHTIPQGKLFWAYTIATKSNEILWDVTWWPGFDKGTNPYAYKFLPSKTSHLSGKIGILTWNDTDKNYHHRITTIVPKYYIMKQSGLSIDKYIADINLPFHKEWREALGVSESMIIPSDPTVSYQCDELICTNATTISWFIQPRVKEYLCSLFLPTKTTTKPTRKIYVKRITSRKVVNEQEFEELMTAYGFEIHVMEGMSIRQQAALFHESNFIISTHGAGLTNMVFCQKWTKIIEIFHPQTIFGHYYAMAWTLGLPYLPIVGEMQKDLTKIEMDNDIILDISEVRKVIDKTIV